MVSRDAESSERSAWRDDAARVKYNSPRVGFVQESTLLSQQLSGYTPASTVHSRAGDEGLPRTDSPSVREAWRALQALAARSGDRRHGSFTGGQRCVPADGGWGRVWGWP